MTPAQRMGLKVGDPVWYDGSHPEIAACRATLCHDDGTTLPGFDFDSNVPQGHAAQGARANHGYYMSLSRVRPLTPEELAEEWSEALPTAPTPVPSEGGWERLPPAVIVEGESDVKIAQRLGMTIEDMEWFAKECPEFKVGTPANVWIYIAGRIGGSP